MKSDVCVSTAAGQMINYKSQYLNTLKLCTIVVEESSVVESSLVDVFQHQVVIEQQRWFRSSIGRW